MAAITSRPTSTGASRCLQLEDTQKTNVKCAFFDTEDHNRTTLTGGVRHRIFMVIRRSIALRTLSMNLPDQRAVDIYTQAGRAETVADIEHSTSQTTWTRKRPHLVQATVFQCIPKTRMGVTILGEQFPPTENTLAVPQVRTTKYDKKSFKFAVAVLWNSFPDNFRQVNKGIVLPVEVHALQSQTHSQPHWFQHKHLQETVQIVKEAVESRLSQNKATEKSTQQNSSIITGESLRLGYVFKARPTSQQCLVPGSSLSQREQQDIQEGELHSLCLAKEKLVIYACQRQVGSPQRMSQLVRMLGEKTHSASKGVSISSYFQKVSATSASSSQSETSTTSIPATTVVPKSGGKRNILKKITLKVDSNVSNKRQKSTRPTSKSSSSIQQFLQKEQEVEQTLVKTSRKVDFGKYEFKKVKAENSMKAQIGRSDDVIDIDHSDESSDAFPRSTDTTNVNSKSAVTVADSCLSTSDENIETKTANSQGEREELSMVDKDFGEESISSDQNTVKISQVFNTSIPISLSTVNRDNFASVTLIGVDQMNEIQEQKERKHSNHSDVLLADTESQDSSGDQFKLNMDKDDPDISVLPSASFISQPSDSLQSPFPGLNENKHNKHKPIPENLSSRKSPDLDYGYSSDSVDSPVFTRKKHEQQMSEDVVASSNKSIEQPNHQEMTKEDLAKTKPLKRDKENKILKRKLPNFSDSDSDHNEMPLITRKIQPKNKTKFVKLDEPRANSRKFSISKSFFTDTEEKRQPTLSFFMENKEKKRKVDLKGHSSNKLIKEELENIDCSLIEELSFIVNVKCETDSQIQREIKELKEVNELNEEHLSYLVRHSEPYLRDIFEGKIHSSRHLAYKQGGKSKRDLNFESCLSLYTEEQVDTVMEALMEMFCKRHHKYLDYIMKVLLQEMLIKFHMEIHNLSKEESEERMIL